MFKTMERVATGSCINTVIDFADFVKNQVSQNKLQDNHEIFHSSSCKCTFVMHTHIVQMPCILWCYSETCIICSKTDQSFHNSMHYPVDCSIAKQTGSFGFVWICNIARQTGSFGIRDKVFSLQYGSVEVDNCLHNMFRPQANH